MTSTIALSTLPDSTRLSGKRTVRLAGVAAACTLAFGCGSSDAGAPDSTDTSSSELLVCPTDLVMQELDGTERTLEDYYHPRVINERLTLNPALREAAGLAAVTTCDEARHVMATQQTLQETEASLVSPGAAASETVDKIYKGVPVTTDFAYVWIGNQTDGGWCSSVAFGKRLFNGAVVTDLLTSAHCFPNSGTKAINVGLQKVAGAAPESQGVFFGAVTRHPQFAGSGDTANDIAIVGVLGWDYGATLYVQTSTTMSTNWPFVARGFGSSDATTQNGPSLRAGWNDGTFEADWVGSGHFLDSNDSDVNLCKGDSGGPALRYGVADRAVIHGIASNADMLNGKICRTPGNDLKERWTRVNTHTAWIQSVRGACTFLNGGANGSWLRCW